MAHPVPGKWKAALVLMIAACSSRAVAPPGGTNQDAGNQGLVAFDAAAGAAPDAAPDTSVIIDAGPPQIDPDGNDDEEDPGTGTLPSTAKWEKVGTPPLALTRICDLTPLKGALYAAHAHQPLGTDGATITRYRPDDTQRPFTIGYDWNRPGEPTKGGGAGQGFVRVHAIDGRLYVPDADPPYGGLGLIDGAEGYVFISDDQGKFAPPRGPHFSIPSTAAILPRAYHVLDVIKFRGALYASTGSVPPKEPAWRGPSPGALHKANDAGTRWLYEVDYPYPYKDGVWRLTYMVRFKDRLYAGIQDFDGRDPNDFVYFTPSGPGLKREDLHPMRVTPKGASGTLRWWVDTKTSKLYWLAWTKQGVGLFVSSDGDKFDLVTSLPEESGRITDITRFRDDVVVLTERGLYRLDGRLIAAAEGKKSPFEISDFFCTAPLAVMNNVLYAGGQRGGTLYRLAE